VRMAHEHGLPVYQEIGEIPPFSGAQ